MSNHSSLPNNLSIMAALNRLCRELSQVRVKIDLQMKDDEILEPLKIIIFRISEEALKNVVKYSKASLLSICVSSDGSFLNLDIQDNGLGFDAEMLESQKGKNQGLGLLRMEGMASLSGGFFSIHSSAENDTLVQASWPLHITQSLSDESRVSGRWESTKELEKART